MEQSMTCGETDEEILDDGLDDEDDEAKEQEEEEEKPSVDVLGSSIPYQVVNDSLYLEKKSVFQLLALTSKQPGYPSRHGYRQESSTSISTLGIAYTTANWRGGNLSYIKIFIHCCPITFFFHSHRI